MDIFVHLPWIKHQSYESSDICQGEHQHPRLSKTIGRIKRICSPYGYEVVKEFSEKVTGAKKLEEREALSDLLDYVESNEVDKVLIYECSRLSRRAVDFLAVIEQLIAQGVSVFGTVLNIPIAQQ